MIVFGRRLFGKCDAVPGMFYVATQFFHLYYCPLIPLGTHLVFGTAQLDPGGAHIPLVYGSFGGMRYHTVPLPLSLKSILLAWTSTASFFIALMGTVIAIALAADRGDDSLPTLILVTALAAAVFLLTFILPRIKRPSYARACQLAGRLQLTDQGWAALNTLYGRDPLTRPDGTCITPATTPHRVPIE